MTAVTKVKTGSKMEGVIGYSRAVVVNDLIFISNTAGRDPISGEMPDNFADQFKNAIATIERSLKSVGSSLGDIVSYRAYVPYPEDLENLPELLGSVFRGIDPCCTVICSPLAAPYYKFEIETVAHRGVADAKVEKINIG